MIGARFGDHQVLRQIAGGFASKVFLASDGIEVCAVKIFAPPFRERAEREFEVGKDLDHPRLNRVDALLEIGGRAAVKMPFVPGVQLSRWLPMHGQTAHGQPGHGRNRGIVAVVSETLEGIEHLHDRHVVHRDVKPENILIGRDDHPVLIDFDLAAHAGERVGERGWAGTAAYLSPERAAGAPARPADDLYSAGVVLYWGLTGVLPFEGGIEAVVAAHESAEPTPPSQHDTELAAFDPFLGRVLARDPSDRFASAREMRAQLASLAGD